VLEISVWKEPDLTTKATVRPDGKIGLPLLSDVQASGLATQQLREYLQVRFAQYVNDPLVSVIVTDPRSQMVHIIGSVKSPGSYRLGGPLTVMELLARAGGLSDFAKKEDITIVRTEGGRTVREMFNYKTFVEGKNLQQNISLRNGDVVVVP
jgi:polysaccharide biosynthesis/export protein